MSIQKKIDPASFLYLLIGIVAGIIFGTLVFWLATLAQVPFNAKIAISALAGSLGLYKGIQNTVSALREDRKFYEKQKLGTNRDV